MRVQTSQSLASCASWLFVSAASLCLSGCFSLSKSTIAESTAPPFIGTTKNPSVSGEHKIIVTFSDIHSTSQWDLRDAAIERAKSQCPKFAITNEIFRTGEETTSEMKGIGGPWIELTVVCAKVTKRKLRGAAAGIVETLSEKLPHTAFFDTHSEEFSAGFETVFGAITRVLTNQGDAIYRSDKERGIIITGRARQGMPGFPIYEQYVIVIDDDESTNKTKVTFKLLVHSPNFGMEGGVTAMPPVERKFVYQRAAAFVDNIKRSLR